MAISFPPQPWTSGETFTNDETGVVYIYDGDQWLANGSEAALETDKDVRKEVGDSMEGPLYVTGGRNEDADGLVSSVRALNIDSGQNSDLQLKHDGNTKVYVGGTNVSLNTDVKFGKTNAEIKGKDNTALMIVGDKDVQYKGESSNEFDLVTKSYVDDGDSRLQAQITLNTQSIINNAEEIDTITADVVKKNNKGLTLERYAESAFYFPEPFDLICCYRKIQFDKGKNWESNYDQLNFVKFALGVVDRKTNAFYAGGVRMPYDTVGNNNEHYSVNSPRLIGDKVVFAPSVHTDGAYFLEIGSSTDDPDKPWVVEAREEAVFSKHKGCPRWSIMLDDRRILYLGNPLDGFKTNGPGTNQNPLSGDGPNQMQIVALLDTDDFINDVAYETFDRLDNEGNNVTGIRAYTKLIADDIGGAPATINFSRKPNERFTVKTHFIVQAGKHIKRVVEGDLDNKEVTLVDESAAPLTFEYINVNGNRSTYKGKVNGLTPYEDRYLIWHSLGEGILAYDVIDQTITNLYSTDNTIQYGIQEYNNYAPAVPALFGSLYYVPDASTQANGVAVPVQVLVVNPDLSVDTIPVPASVYQTAGYWRCTDSSRTSNNEIFCLGERKHGYKYNAVDKRWMSYYMDESASSTFRVNGVVTLVPNSYYFAPNHWNYIPAHFLELVNGLNPNIVENTDWSFLGPDLNLGDVYAFIDYTEWTSPNGYPLTLKRKGSGWTGSGNNGQFWYDFDESPIHIGFKGSTNDVNNYFFTGVSVRITHANGVTYAQIASSWYSGQIHLNLENQYGDVFEPDTEVTSIAYGEYLPTLLRTTGGTMTGDLVMGGNQIKEVGDATADTDAINLRQAKQVLHDLFVVDTVQGTWGVDNVQSLTNPGAGRMVLQKENGQAAAKFSEVVMIRFYENNDTGESVNWFNWSVGENIKFVQTADETVTGTFRIMSGPNTSGTTQTITVEYLTSENDLAPFGNYMEQYQVTLSQLRIPLLE